MIICPKCGAANLSSALECYNCKATLGTKTSPSLASSGSSSVTAPKPDVLVLPSGGQIILNGVMFIGSDPAHCQIVLNDPSVSPIHAQVEVVQPGTVVLKDLGSTTGTTLNGYPIPPKTPAQLADNTKIAIGKFILIYLKGTPSTPLIPISSSAPSISSPPVKPKTLISPPSPKPLVLAPSFVQIISSFLFPPSATFSGYVVGVHISQQKMPISAGRVMVVLGLCIIASYLLVVLIPIWIVAAIFGCAFLPIVLLTLGSFGYLSKLILGNDVVQQTAFRVQEPTTKIAMPVVLFSDRGGTVILTENDKVTVSGVLQPNNTLLAEQIVLEEQNGVAIVPPAIIRGKLPIPPQIGLIWLILALLPCIWLWLASLGR